MTDGTGADAPVGRFCWPETNVKDVAKAKAFYTALFGWTVRSDADGVYSEWQLDGQSLGGLMALGEREQMGIPSHWMAYVKVASCDESAAKVKEAGGRVLHGPFDMEGVGRFAAIQDPTGAMFSLYQAAKPGDAVPTGVPGSMCWNELMTPDTEKAAAFYTAVFGWATQVVPMGTPSGDYTLFLHEGAMAAGMMAAKGPGFEKFPPAWVTYFAVEDCDATVAKAQELGATVCVPPTDIPNIGRFSMISDPQGAVFAVLRFST